VINAVSVMLIMDFSVSLGSGFVLYIVESRTCSLTGDSFMDVDGLKFNQERVDCFFGCFMRPVVVLGRGKNPMVMQERNPSPDQVRHFPLAT
jgi:hypothetical protein